MGNEKIVDLERVAKQYFEELERVKVFHKTPKSAASHIENIWPDALSWWESSEVKKAIDKFKKNYCFRPKNITNFLLKDINQIINQ